MRYMMNPITVMLTVTLICNISRRDHYRITTGSLPDHYRITTGSLPDHYRITTGSLPDHYRITTGSLPDHYRITTGSLPDHYRITTGSFFFYFVLPPTSPLCFIFFITRMKYNSYNMVCKVHIGTSRQ